jgi:uncharacterized protein (TIGR01777 family)
MDVRDKIILVTGGTGFIGRPLCERLVREGARLFVLTRSSQHISTDRISYIGTLSDLEDSHPDIIINLAGEPIAQRWTAAKKDKIFRSRIETTAAIINYIKLSGKKPSLLISGSAIGIYGVDEGAVFHEDTRPVTTRAAFSRSLCAAWEKEAVKAELYGVRTVLLRIGAVMGKDGGVLQKLLMPFRLGLGGPIGHGRQWFSWIDRDDLIGIILHIIHTPKITGPVNATAPNPVSNRVFAKALADVLGKPCMFPAPAFAMRLVFGAMADEIMLEGQKVMPQKAIESGYKFLYPGLTASLQKILCRKTEGKSM